MTREDYSQTLEAAVTEHISSRKTQGLATQLAEAYGVHRNRATTHINNWREGLVYGTSSMNPLSKELQLERLSHFLGVLGISKDHQLIMELTSRFPSFSYKK